jgi:zinc transporter, ZIP family
LSPISCVRLTIGGYLPGVGQAILFGVIASSALVLGALAGGRLQLPKRVLAGMLAFAAGALITALTFEMFEDSYQKGGIWRAAAGLAVGSVVFTVVSQRLDRMAEGNRKDDHGSEKLDLDAAAQDAPASPASVSGAAGLALLAAATLDGVPENLVLGVALGEGSGGIALLAAIFVANFPEALVGSASMRVQGRSQAFILGTWTVCALLLVFAVVVGAGPLSRATHETFRYLWPSPLAPSWQHSPTR